MSCAANELGTRRRKAASINNREELPNEKGSGYLTYPGALLRAVRRRDCGRQTIAGVVFQEDQFMKMLADGYAAAARIWASEILQSNTNNDQSKETEIINTYVSQGIAGVAISPLNSDTSAATLKDASDAASLWPCATPTSTASPTRWRTTPPDNFTFCNQTARPQWNSSRPPIQPTR